MGGLTNFPNGLSSFGIPMTGGVPFGKNSKCWFVSPANGNDGNPGTSPQQPFATLYQAHNKAVSGRGDTIFLISDGSTSGTARLSTALAQTIDSSATTGVLTWSKNNTHLIGITAPTMVGQRARIAPPSGTYTQATFGSGNFLVISGSGCMFANFSIFHGFSTGGTNQIAVTVTGSRNYFENVDFGGMGDDASAQNTGSRSLKIGSSGSGENTFVRCKIGLDTVTRTVANASIELAGGTPRNTFIDCVLPFQTSNAGVLGILGTGASCIDRWNRFVNCSFINNIKSTSTQMSVLASLTNASPGGLLSFEGCRMIGVTEWGDTNGLANSYVDMAAPSASAGGIGVNPS